MLSSAGTPPKRAELQSAGISRCLTKPVKQSDLLDAIGELMGTATRDDPVQANPPSKKNYRKNLRILLAEDGRVNQVVALNLLKGKDHIVTVANNGAEAVRAHAKEPFDVVLMDVQMPEMNGFEATKAIRSAEGASSAERHTPIVAMTANAMKGDREDCLAAGMDGYVAKPIRSESLLDAIEAVLGPVDSQARPQNESVPSRTDASAPFDANTFRESCGTDDLAKELLVIFHEDVPPLMKTLEGALTAGDTDQAHQAAHALKGLVGNYAAEGTHAKVTALDQAARTGDLSGARAEWAAVREAIDELGEALSAYKVTLP